MKSFLLPCLWWIDRLFDEGRIQNLDLGPTGNVNGGFVIKRVAILLQSTADPNRKCLLYNADQFFIMICKEMQQAYGKKAHYYRQQTNFSHNHPLQLWQALLVCVILIQLKRTFLHLWLAGVATFLLLWLAEVATLMAAWAWRGEAIPQSTTVFFSTFDLLGKATFGCKNYVDKYLSEWVENLAFLLPPL